ncbi:hypothetical protein C2845_PM01G49010 [Panicum miliaceum]|uniref:Uncharacterized protein n=1 Tax=Panicum miliaceum TaxID=4540 RepID=A0A3L6TH95_PANMI|nr:hypothetical protein C2845_PM01G49010 [Panicum miliaceum]
MGDPPALKRPKLEKDDHDSAYCPRPSANGTAPVPPAASASADASGAPPNDEDEEVMAEEAVVALVAHRERDVERCKLKLLHYQSLPAGRPQLVIPGANSRPAPRPEPMPGLKKAAAPSSSSSPVPPPERSRKEEKKPKRKIEEKQHQNLIPNVKKSSATVLKFQGGTLVSSQHKRKLRCLELCPSNDQLVVTRAPGRQLRLFDIRLRQTEIHAFGWKQESSESQSALINQSWSPDGWYLSSGSADPVIHIFDIRYHSQNPCQSVQAHQKRVFKAVWHQTLPYLTSISSDLNVGIHKYS